jgi:hypothetical protein
MGEFQKIVVEGFLRVLAGRPFSALDMSPVESQVALAHARRGLEGTQVHRYLLYYFWTAQR